MHVIQPDDFPLVRNMFATGRISHAPAIPDPRSGWLRSRLAHFPGPLCVDGICRFNAWKSLRSNVRAGSRDYAVFEDDLLDWSVALDARRERQTLGKLDL